MTSICIQSCIPMRNTASESAEMVSQLLFGESFSIIKKQDNWTQVANLTDNYIGWIDSKLIVEISPEHSEVWKHDAQYISSKYTELLCHSNNSTITLSAGSRIINKKDFAIGNYKFSLNSESAKISNEFEFIKQYLNTSYLWGGRSIWGIDCSGLVQHFLAYKGINAERDASDQYKTLNKIPFTERSMGDIAFFENENGNITHTGICIEKGKIIHASGFVRIDHLTNEGIVCSNTGKLTHKLTGICSTAK